MSLRSGLDGLLQLVLGSALLRQQQRELAVALPEAGGLIHADEILLAGFDVQRDGRGLVVRADAVGSGRQLHPDAASVADARNFLIVDEDGGCERRADVAALTVDAEVAGV